MKGYLQNLSVPARSDVQDISLETTWTILSIVFLNCPPWPGSTLITCMSHHTTGGPGKERGTNKLSPTGTRKKRPKGERGCQSVCPSSLPESSSLESILAEWYAATGPWVRTTGQRQQGTNPITWDCKLHGRAVLLGSLILLLSTQVPLPSKVSCFISMCVFSDNLFLS